MIKIQRALLSVHDKTNLEGLVRALYREKVELIATSSTKKAIEALGIPVQEVSSYTGFPEILDGRVKTLHPKIFGGILCRRDSREHLREINNHAIQSIDLVVVTLYPFEKVVRNGNPSEELALENIDIGGVALLRAAAKNYGDVVALTDIEQYKGFIKEFNQSDGKITKMLSREYASEAFKRISYYDSIIFNYFNKTEPKLKAKHEATRMLPELIISKRNRVMELRYGENPHQIAALYREPELEVDYPRQLHGKPLSYNNLVGLDAASSLVNEFRKGKCAAIIKHTNPCGIAISKSSLADAFVRARESDPVSFFGGIIATNSELDELTAKLVSENFFDAIIAPSYSKEALNILSNKKKLIIVEHPSKVRISKLMSRETIFGTLVQTEDEGEEEVLEKKTTVDDTLVDRETALFGIQVCKHVKSNAIVLVKDLASVGVGAGQMSRVDSLKIALEKAGARAQGSIMVSDAFFPMPDCIELAQQHGISAIVQPGGSIRDNDSIDAANKHGIPMYFTGIRHFRH